MYKKWIAVICSIFLFLPISISAYEEEVILGGDSVGIEVGYDGVLITGTYEIQQGEQSYDPSVTFQKGDIIKEVNGQTIETIAQLHEQIAHFQEETNEIETKVQRGNTTQTILMKTFFDKEKKVYQSGLYVKDKIVGVGTLTFYLPNQKRYGALGHEIYDADLKEASTMLKGTLYESEVSSITKAVPKQAGEKHALIHYNDPLATIDENTAIGIYGTFYDEKEGTRIGWSKQEEIELGKAKLLTVIQGTTIEAFDIEITKLHEQKQSDIKGIEFVVTDERLKAMSGGIVQGMSGSPILQNDKLIGAVTHVITGSPFNGYGVYIEFMMEEAQQ